MARRNNEPPSPELVAACDRVLPWTALLALVGGALYLARDHFPAPMRAALAEGAAVAPAVLASVLLFVRLQWSSAPGGAPIGSSAAAQGERAGRMRDLAALLEGGRASVGAWTSVLTGKLGGLDLELRSSLLPGAPAAWRVGFPCAWSGVVYLDRHGQLAARGSPPPLNGPCGEALLPLLRDHGVTSLTLDADGFTAQQRESAATLERVPTRSLLGRLRAVALALGAPGAPGAVDVHVTARASGQDGDCPYCRSSISTDERVSCDACGTAHHAECLADHGGCTVLACAGRPRGESERAR